MSALDHQSKIIAFIKYKEYFQNIVTLFLIEQLNTFYPQLLCLGFSHMTLYSYGYHEGIIEGF